jgi:WD40 repeat protein
LKSPLAHRVLSLCFSGDGEELVTGGGSPSRNGELKIWKVSDGSLVREIKPSHSDTIYSTAISPDGKYLATASADKLIKIFDMATGQWIKTLSGHTHYVLGVDWKADGRMLASCGADKVVKLWAFPSGDQIKTIEGFKGEVTAVRYLGLGAEVMAATGDARVRILKEDGGGRDLGVDRDKGFIFSIAATPDGRYVLGGGQDSVLHAWETTGNKKLFSLDPPVAEVEKKDLGQSK